MAELTISVKIPAGSPEEVGRKFERRTRRLMKQTQEILLEVTKDEIIDRNLVVFGDMLESVEPEELVLVGDIKRAVVGSDDIASAVAERGAEPTANVSGMVNVSEIQAWMEKAGVESSDGNNERFAFAIARAIGQDGQPLHGAPTRPFNAAQKKAKRRIDKLWETTIDNMVREAFTDG
jgi:hypothetical protein